MLSAGFWPKPKGDEDEFWPKLAKDEVGFVSTLVWLFAPKAKEEDAG